MTDLQNLSRSNGVVPADEHADRRRPGRAAMAPQLIPLARDAGDLDLVRDDAAPVRGIAIAMLLSAPIYVGLYYLARWTFS